MAEIDYQQLANELLQARHSEVPSHNRNMSADTVKGVLGVLKERGYTEDSIEAARVQMHGTKELVESTVREALNAQSAGFAETIRDREARATMDAVLNEHYKDAEIGAKLKKMDVAIRNEVSNRFFKDNTLSDRWNKRKEAPTQEISKLCDDVVDEYAEDIFGKARKTNPAITQKPSSSETTTAVNAGAGQSLPGSSQQKNSSPDSDFEARYNALSEDQQGMFDARFRRLKQFNKTVEQARNEAFDVAESIPTRMPTRGLSANMVRRF
jgi:hypothetical protein